MDRNPYQFKFLMICVILLLHKTEASEKSSKYMQEYLTGHIHSFPDILESDEVNSEIPAKVADTKNSNENNNPLDNIEKHKEINGNTHHQLHSFIDGRNIYKALRHCDIEVTQRIKGVCESIRPIGAACVSGDYMDVFNSDCMSY